MLPFLFAVLISMVNFLLDVSVKVRCTQLTSVPGALSPGVSIIFTALENVGTSYESSVTVEPVMIDTSATSSPRIALTVEDLPLLTSPTKAIFLVLTFPSIALWIP